MFYSSWSIGSRTTSGQTAILAQSINKGKKPGEQRTESSGGSLLNQQDHLRVNIFLHGLTVGSNYSFPPSSPMEDSLIRTHQNITNPGNIFFSFYNFIISSSIQINCVQEQKNLITFTKNN